MVCVFCGGTNQVQTQLCEFCGQPLQDAGPSFDRDYDPRRSHMCLVCGAVLAPAESVCGMCHTPRGMRLDPSSPTAGAYVRTAEPSFMNTSGMHASVPDQVSKGWNWGAFGLHWIWGIPNRSPITFLSLLAAPALFASWLFPSLLIFPFGLVVLFGVKGNEWAWQNRRFDSIEHFHAVQRAWAIWTVGILAACTVVGVACGLAALVWMARG